MNTFVTKDAMRLYEDSFDGPPSHRLEDYYPGDWILARGDGDQKIYCTTEEREDFERETEIALTADVIENPRDYDEFVRYLTENCDLSAFQVVWSPTKS